MTLRNAVTISVVVFAVLVGGLLALVTSFYVPTRLASVSVGVVLCVLTIGPYVHWVGRALRSAMAAAVPALAWLGVTMYLATKRPEGDLVITGSLAGLLFLLLGTVSAAVGIGTVRAGIERSARRAAEREESTEPEAVR